MKTTTASFDPPDSARAAQLLASTLESSPATEPVYAWEAPTAEMVGAWFPEYEVDTVVGRGAMGAVYRAQHQKLGRQVAIKLLPTELAQREGMEARFEQEAQAMSQLNHANIVALHDFGRTTEGHLYIVMEYVEGADLSRIIHAEGGGMDVPQALAVVGQVCDALQYAHGRGFVHRDIKPSNILVDTEGKVKLVDFGLAKLLSQESQPQSDNGPLTMTGAAVGTPDYTAPEQLSGAEVDHRADIYSLGVMFYEMLTGDLPRGAWSKPSRLVPEASPGLDAVVSRAMQAEPDHRFQQASEVKEAVEGATAVAASGRASRKSKALLVGGSLCLCGGILVAGVLGWQGKNNEPKAEPAVQAPVPIAEPSERALKEMNGLINELGDAQEHLAHRQEFRGGPTKYTGPDEQEKKEGDLQAFRKKLTSAIASGFAKEHALVLEARNRLTLLESAHQASSLPDLPPEKCLNPDWRNGFACAGYFEGEEYLGIKPVLWHEKNRDGWHYYVESVAELGSSVPTPDGDLQDYPDFWSIEIPLSRPSLPLSSPHSQAEASWIGEQFPEATSGDGPGLVLAEFEAAGNPQMSWKYWSRHTEDLIPWAQGHPVAAPKGRAKGRVVFKGGNCEVVFDDLLRPELRGGDYVLASGWVTHLRLWDEMDMRARTLSGDPLPPARTWPAEFKELQSRFGDYCAPDCIAHQEEAARMHAPWSRLWQDTYYLGRVQSKGAATNTDRYNRSETIRPFKNLRDRRVLVTGIVCSRERAAKIAQRHGGSLLKVDSKEDLDALAKILPEGLMAHTAPVSDEDLHTLPFWIGSRVEGQAAEAGAERRLPEGQFPTIYRKGDQAYLMPVPARALLVLEWPPKK